MTTSTSILHVSFYKLRDLENQLCLMRPPCNTTTWLCFSLDRGCGDGKYCGWSIVNPQPLYTVEMTVSAISSVECSGMFCACFWNLQQGDKTKPNITRLEMLLPPPPRSDTPFWSLWIPKFRLSGLFREIFATQPPGLAHKYDHWLDRRVMLQWILMVESSAVLRLCNKMSSAGSIQTVKISILPANQFFCSLGQNVVLQVWWQMTRNLLSCFATRTFEPTTWTSYLTERASLVFP